MWLDPDELELIHKIDISDFIAAKQLVVRVPDELVRQKFIIDQFIQS